MRTSASARRRAGLRVSSSAGGSVRAWRAVWTRSRRRWRRGRRWIRVRPSYPDESVTPSCCTRFGPVGPRAVPEVRTRTPQLPQIVRAGEEQERVLQRAQLQVVALDPRRGDGRRRTAGDLTVAPRRTDLRQEFAHPTGFDRTLVPRPRASRCDAGAMPGSKVNRPPRRSHAGVPTTRAARTRLRAGRSPRGDVPTRRRSRHRATTTPRAQQPRGNLLSRQRPTDVGGAAPVNGAHEEVPRPYQTDVRKSTNSAYFPGCYASRQARVHTRSGPYGANPSRSSVSTTPASS